MSKIFILVSIILTCFIFVGCNTTPSTNSTKNDPTENISTETNSTEKRLTRSTYEVNTFDKASISDISFANGIVSLTFTYSGENQLQLGDWFILEINKNGVWYTFPYDNENFFGLEAYPIKPNLSKTLEYNLKYTYNTLPTGKYRIVTEAHDFVESGDYTKYYLAAEFEIR